MAAFGVGLAGSGWLLFYYFGALSVLIKQGIYVPGRTEIGGLSGGGVTAVQTCAQVPVEQQMLGFKGVLEYCNKNHPGDVRCGGKLGSLTAKSVRKNLRSYSSAKCMRQCNGKLHVSVSALNPDASNLLQPTPWLVSNNTGRNDLVQLTAATGHIVCYTNLNSPYTVFRGVPCIDGAYTSNFKDCCRPNLARCLKLAAYKVGPNNPTGKEGCQSQATFVSDYSNPLSSSSQPATLSTQPSSWNLPRKCRFDPKTGLPISPKAPAFTTVSTPDIYPGYSPLNPLSVDPCEWQSWALDNTRLNSTVIQLMYDTGVKDAEVWIQQNLAASTG